MKYGKVYMASNQTLQIFLAIPFVNCYTYLSLAVPNYSSTTANRSRMTYDLFRSKIFYSFRAILWFIEISCITCLIAFKKTMFSKLWYAKILLYCWSIGHQSKLKLLWYNQLLVTPKALSYLLISLSTLKCFVKHIRTKLIFL